MNALHDTVETPHSIERMIRRVSDLQLDALDRELAPYDITAAQFFILAGVVSAEASSASGLCKRISYDPGAMTRMVDRLEQKGLLQRVARLDDRRTQRLELTPRGKDLYPQLRDCALTVQNRFRRGFTPSEVRQLEGFLQRTLANA